MTKKRGGGGEFFVLFFVLGCVVKVEPEGVGLFRGDNKSWKKK